jgi:mRNA interferase RelE/StbE
VSWRVAFTRRAEKELAELDKRTQARMVAALEGLCENPFDAPQVKALTGGGYRLRVGDYRILFDVVSGELLILVVKVGHRREVYR